MVVMIALVTTGLVITLVSVVAQGLRTTRRSGDSAHALQVADAGINDALSAVAKETGGSASGGDSVGAASYTYNATRDSYVVSPSNPSVTAPIWHIDAVGTDAAGVQRRVKADALGVPLFTQAVFVNQAGTFGTGLAIDSYRSGAEPCTGRGIAGSNDPSKLVFGNGNGGPQGNAHENCGGDWPVDACIAYGPADGSQGYPPLAGVPGHCPTKTTVRGTVPGTWLDTPYFVPRAVKAPTGGGVEEHTNFTCKGLTTGGQGSPANPLEANKVYRVSNLNLFDGCTVSGGNPALVGSATDPTTAEAGAAKVFVTGSVKIGSQTGGAGNKINEPPKGAPDTSGVCGATGMMLEPGSYYCPGWPKTLQVYILGSGSVEFANNGMRFWGLVHGPKAPASFSAPGMDIYGAMLTSSAGGSTSAPSPQWNWHFDESISGILSGQYELRNWREEPLG